MKKEHLILTKEDFSILMELNQLAVSDLTANSLFDLAKRLLKVSFYIINMLNTY